MIQNSNLFSFVSFVQKKNDTTQKYYKKEICPHLDFGKIHKNTKVKVYQVVEAILYRLKTGCQWRELPMKQFFNTNYKWQSVYYHFQKWCKNGNWAKVWRILLNKYQYISDNSDFDYKKNTYFYNNNVLNNSIMKRFIFLSFISFLLTSCSTVVFEKAMPAKGKQLKTFPKEMQGVYLTPDSTKLEITATTAKEIKETNTPTISLIDIDLAQKDVLKKKDNIYYLNMEDNGMYFVIMFEHFDNKLEVYSIVLDEKKTGKSEEEIIKEIKKITKVKAHKQEDALGNSTVYILNPSQKEFEKLIQQGLFVKLGTMTKIQ